MQQRTIVQNAKHPRTSPIATVDRSSATSRVLEEIGAIVWEGDPRTYAFTYVSPAAEQLLGYPAARWIEDPSFWVSHIHPDDRDWVVAFCHEHTIRLEDHQFDYRMIAANGEVVWLRDLVRVESRDGRPVRSAGVMVDVTSLKEAEARAEQEATRFRTCLRDAPIVFFALDAAGVFTIAEGEDRGFLPGRVVGAAVDEIYAHNPTVVEHARRALAGEHHVSRIEERGRTFEVAWTPMHDESGARTGVVGVATDITMRKQLEERLRQQQRLESVETLASGVAHEINNPVQGILNYAELIAEHPNDPELVREFAFEITRESDRVATIVRSLLAFSRREPEQPPFERCAVRPLIEDTLSLVRSVLRKDQIALVITAPDDLPPIHCRVQQIQQILMNLVTNARDAINQRQCHGDKRITIRARAHTRDGRRWVRISVADRAGGIPNHVRGRIFDPFFTTKGRDQGTGLGLSVSHAIATEHEGELSVDSEPGIGSVFHLDLPAG